MLYNNTLWGEIMFGEKGFFGTYNVKRDNGCRITFPRQSGLEMTDDLVFLNSGNYITVYESTKLLSIIEKLEEKIENCNDLNLKKQLKQQYKELLKSIIKQTKSDSYRRIVISGILDEEKEIVIMGAGNKALLLTKKQYKDYYKN